MSGNKARSPEWPREARLWSSAGLLLGQPSIDRFLKPETLEIKEVPENTTGLLKIDVTLP